MVTNLFHLFCTFWADGGDTSYWLEMRWLIFRRLLHIIVMVVVSLLRQVMLMYWALCEILVIMIHISSWWGPKYKKVITQQIDTHSKLVHSVNSGRDQPISV